MAVPPSAEPPLVAPPPVLPPLLPDDEPAGEPIDEDDPAVLDARLVVLEDLELAGEVPVELAPPELAPDDVAPVPPFVPAPEAPPSVAAVEPQPAMTSQSNAALRTEAS